MDVTPPPTIAADPGEAVDAPPPETPSQRYNRNWNELLQELRVIQTGTQIVTGFLLTLPFQPRFRELGAFDVGLYLVLIAVAVSITLLTLAPVSIHRILFRQGAKADLVTITNRVLLTALVAASLLFAGLVLFVVDFVLHPLAGMIVGGSVLAVVASLWVALPLVVRSRRRRDADRHNASGSTP